MPFFKKQDLGRIYLIKIILPDEQLIYKIGMCHSSRATDRMMEILRSWFCYFRFVPYTELKLDMECSNPALVEKYIHQILNKHRFTPNFKVQGSTEMFVDLDEVKLLWFIKSVVSSRFSELPKLDKNQCNIISNLLTDNYVR